MTGERRITRLNWQTRISWHQALIFSANLSWRPGTHYIEFPDQNQYRIQVSIVHRWIYKGINNFLGSDVDYDKWTSRLATKLTSRSRVSWITDFPLADSWTTRKLAPDYQHFNGNQAYLLRLTWIVFSWPLTIELNDSILLFNYQHRAPF